MGEIWALVDINEKETGVLIERGTHTPIPQGMFHTAVDIWTKNRSGKILLTQRHPSKEWGLQWACSGGALVKDETAVQGAQRELLEETGIVLPEDAFLYLGKTIMEEYQCIMYTFLVEIDDDVELNLQEEEVVDAKWVTIDELENLENDIVCSVWGRWRQFKNKIS